MQITLGTDRMYRYIKKYIVVACDCGHAIVLSSRRLWSKSYRVNCPFCGRRTLLKKLRVLATSDDLDELRLWAWDWNRKKFKK